MPTEISAPRGQPHVTFFSRLLHASLTDDARIFGMHADTLTFSGQFGGNYTLVATDKNTIVNFPAGAALDPSDPTLFVWKRIK